MLRNIFLEGITALLICLFMYAAASKLLDAGTFSEQMQNQPLPAWIKDNLTWLIPTSELVVSALLLVRALRIYGLILSFLLLLVFTGYVGMIYLHFFDRIPCSCGGVFRSMSWGTHLVFNAAFTLLALAGIYLQLIKSLEYKRT